jgi:serine/threonine protein phosphatase PrpC
MHLKYKLGIHSDIGKRQINEDAVGAVLPKDSLLQDRGLILAIADGVSTGGGGRVAAQTSVRSLVEDYMSTPATWDISVALEKIIHSHNSWLYKQNQQSEETQMLTTLTTMVIHSNQFILAHIGDSRAYVFRQNTLHRLTQDHTHRHPDMRNVLTRAMGLDKNLHVDFIHHDTFVGDLFILMTDGIHGALSEKEIKMILKEGKDPQEIAEKLCANAGLSTKSNGDNASVIILQIEELPQRKLKEQLEQQIALPIPAKLTVGSHFEGMEVNQIVASNGVTMVYQLFHPQLNEQVLLKTLDPSRKNDRVDRSMLAHEIWLTEVLQGADEICTSRKPPNGDKKHLYLLTEWIEGETLEQRLQKNPQGYKTQEIIDIGIQISKLLSKLHRRKVIHRDIKPANIIIDTAGRLRILDLGSAAAASDPAEVKDLHTGTPSYINPEQWEGENADQQSDLFALGVSLYELLTGKLPYGSVEPHQIAAYERDPTPLTRYRKDIPKWLETILLKSISRKKKFRFETAEELLLSLERGSARPLPKIEKTLTQSSKSELLWIALIISIFINIMLILYLLMNFS